MIERFFEADREVLEDPDRLRGALANSEMLLRPVIPWSPADELRQAPLELERIEETSQSGVSAS